MRIEEDLKLDFKDVLIRPKRSEAKSRKDVILKREYTFRNGKKPTDFIKFLISIGCLKKNAIILDFFAGSGSTG